MKNIKSKLTFLWWSHWPHRCDFEENVKDGTERADGSMLVHSVCRKCGYERWTRETVYF